MKARAKVKLVQTRIAPEAHRELERHAGATGKSIAACVKEAIADYLETRWCYAPGAQPWRGRV